MAIIHILERQAQELGLGVGGRCLLPTRLRITGRFCFPPKQYSAPPNRRSCYITLPTWRKAVVDMAADDAVYSP
jgi:hypothetical protein